MPTLTERQKQAQRTRIKITETAMEMLKTTSYENVKVSDICKNAGISVGNFYHYFKSKDMLIKETYDIMDKKILDNYNGEKYISYIDSIIALNKSAAAEMQKLGHTFLSSAYRQLIIDDEEYTISPERQFHHEILNLVNKAIENKELKNVNPEKFAEYLNMTGRGVIFDWCIKRGNFDIISVWTEHISNIIRLYTK